MPGASGLPHPVSSVKLSNPLRRRQHGPAPPPDDAKARAKAVREYGKSGGSEIIPKLETYLADPDVDVRREAVKAIVDIGTQRSLDALIKATRRQRSGNPDSRHRRPGEFLRARLREDRADCVAAARRIVHQGENSPTLTIW